MPETPQVEQLVSDLRKLVSDISLPEEPDFMNEDEMFVRFLKSQNWDLQAAEQMLRKSLNWRKEFQPRSRQCDQCKLNPGCHSLRQIGHDKVGRPILYASFFPAHPSQRNSLNGALVHLVVVIENAIRSMQAGVNQWVFVIDCASMNPMNCHPRFGYEAAQTMSNNYPERLGLAICIKPGAVFRAAWKTMKPFLSAATTSKICIVSNRTQLESVLGQYFSNSMSEWIIREYNSNRQKPAVSRYRPFWHEPLDGSSTHDPRGDKAYVDNWVLVKHPNGHQPHQNITDYLEGKLELNVAGANTACSGDRLEDDDSPETDETTAQHLLDSDSTEYQLPTDMEDLT